MKRWLYIAALAALIMGALAGVAFAEEDDPELTTDVDISFTEAIFFDPLEVGSQNISFGTNYLPTGEVTYYTGEDDTFVLNVCDRRETQGGWTVNAVLSDFISGSNSFTGELRFINPDRFPDDTSGPDLNLTTAAPDPDYILVGGSETEIMSLQARDDGTRIDYQLISDGEKTALVISSTEALKVKEGPYAASVTWTLSMEVGP